MTNTKGMPGLESRTGGWLVSPAAGREKNFYVPSVNHQNLGPEHQFEHNTKLRNHEGSPERDTHKVRIKRLNVSVRRPKKTNAPPMVISDAHRARIPRSVILLVSVY